MRIKDIKITLTKINNSYRLMMWALVIINLLMMNNGLINNY